MSAEVSEQQSGKTIVSEESTVYKRYSEAAGEVEAAFQVLGRQILGRRTLSRLLQVTK